VQETPQKLKSSTGAASLEEAFIKLTGHGIRHEDASSTDHMRQVRKVWRR
jgi:hypothetical protein